MRDLLSGLNPEQRQAVMQIEGPVLVLAGAGTGKTRVITTRIAYMIEQGIPPEHIAAMTFTNKAANEMRERLARLVAPEAAEKTTLGTFHSFCARILRRDIAYAGNYNPHYSILDDSDQQGIVRQAAAELGYSKNELPAQDVLAYIGRCKNRMLYPEDLDGAGASFSGQMEGYREVYERYQKLLELQNALDFDDMLLLTLKIFREHPERLAYYRDLYRYLLVDEYQDTNAAQSKLLDFLTEGRDNICVVGDDDQSIYGWRGADVGNILAFPLRHPGALEIKLEQNYRSTNSILEAANCVIAKNGKRYEKRLWSHRGQGEEVRLSILDDGESEARFVADMMENLLRSNPDYSYDDFAVLYRSNHMSRLLEQEFHLRGIRPKIIGGQAFFQRKEVKDAAAYLKLVVNERDNQSLLRIIGVPPRGIGEKAILRLRELGQAAQLPLTRILACKEYAESVSAAAAKAAQRLHDAIQNARDAFREPGDLSRKAREYLYATGYLDGFQRIYKDVKEAQARQENVFEFLNFISMFERDWRSPDGEDPVLADFIEKYSLMDDNDRTEQDDGRIAPTFSTVHAAKGLEYPVVFVVGMEEGMFPHERALSEDERGLDEERRLFYVAITRAKEMLILSMARRRFKYGQYEQHRPSPFLSDLPGGIPERLRDMDSFFPKADLEEQRRAFEEIMRALRET